MGRLETKPSNRFCCVRKVRAFSLPAIRKEIERREDVCTGFVACNSGFPATNETLFKVYDDGRDLLVAVCALSTLGARTPGEPDEAVEIEVLFDPYHDHIGYFQFVFEPGKAVALYHHLPYRQSHSTAFRRLRVKRHHWQIVGRRALYDGPAIRTSWLFVWFQAKDVFRAGDVCGFNVERGWPAGRESTSWNLASGIGFPDATAFGHLHRRPVAVDLTDVDVRRAGSGWVMEGRGTLRRGVTLELADPRGKKIPVALDRRPGGWRARATLRQGGTPGRYRLYSRSVGGTAEPGYLAFDLDSPRRRRPFTLGMTVDIVDDLFHAPYTPDVLRAEMDLWRRRGIQRIYWIDYTPPWLESHDEYPALGRHAKQSYRACGDLLPLAARTVKDLGMEFVAVFKPFDLGYRVSRKDWLMQPNPGWWKEPVLPVTSLKIYSTSPVARLKPGDIRLWCSSDNRRYRYCRGAFALQQGREWRPHVRWTAAGNVPDEGRVASGFVELSGLRLTDPYIAVEIRKRNVRLTNIAHALLVAQDARGRDVRVTPANAGDRVKGFSFWADWASWQNRSPRLLEELTWGAGEHGLTFRKEPHAPGLLIEPANEEGRAFWLKAVDRILDTDADAIDIRTLCHHNVVMDYMMHAFAGPVRVAFRARFGRDATASWEDAERVRRLRGEFYTGFLREAKRRAAAKGRRFIAHLESGVEVPPPYDQRMQMHLDWETWIGEGILDEVTLKWWGAQNPFIHERVLPLARRRGVPVHICDWNSSLLTVRAVERAERVVRAARRAGFDGYFFYESADYKFRTAGNVPALMGQAEAAIRRAAEAIVEE